MRLLNSSHGNPMEARKLEIFRDFIMETPIVTLVTAESTAIDTIDDATTVQKDQETPAGTSTTTVTVTSIDAAEPLASGTSPTTVANEENAQALRTVSSSTGNSVTVTQSIQMFNGSHHLQFNDTVLSQFGGNKNETNVVYHIYGSPTIYCSSADLPALRVNSTRSPEIVLQDNTQSQPEHEYMRAGSTLATSALGSQVFLGVSEEDRSTNGVQTGITAPRKVQREAGACEDQPPSSSPCTQGKEDQKATSAVDRDQTSKIFRVDIAIDRYSILYYIPSRLSNTYNKFLCSDLEADTDKFNSFSYINGALSPTEWNLGMMIVTRCIAGAINGNVAVVKSMLAEITDETNQARTFALLPAAYAVGSTIGPLLGGYLSHPVERYSIFERMGFVTVFLSDYPFFLPCFVGSLCNLSAIIFGYFYLQETLTRKPKSKNSEPSSPSPSPPSCESPAISEATPPPKPSLFTVQITRVLTTWFFLAVLNSSYQALIPLFCYSPYPSGGVNFSPSQIGLLLSINVFTCLPLAHWVYPLGSKMVWVVLGGMVAAKTISNMGAVCNNLLINNSAPSRESLGSLNGINQSTSSLARSFGPAGVTTLFALSNEHHLLGGQLVHIVLVRSNHP
ncbi:hypothetical protein K435DRAFT_843978 [Dendrothele bispora CBS 962.96]|uniref:MFS general substrate transporter n=1 Tax=Dendrothele bispora (strain CBS 962.96) TaxID=1314807 RepID=A0A4S8L678_DENBC|nr:hypothetical protein K435DRAFT_843978 [Dendrothele bispora CBS 962.96]